MPDNVYPDSSNSKFDIKYSQRLLFPSDLNNRGAAVGTESVVSEETDNGEIPGIDSVLSVGQLLTANRSIDLNGFNLAINNGVDLVLEVNGLTGALRLANYGVGTFENTPAFILAVDVNGNVIEVSPGSLGSSYSDEQAQDAVGNILNDSQTIDFSYDDVTPAITAAVRYQMSITADVDGLKLSGDVDAPGNSQYYGTDGTGTKGFYDLPSGGGSFALTDGNGTTANGTSVDLGGPLTGSFQIGDATFMNGALSYQPFVLADYNTGWSDMYIGSHVNDGNFPPLKSHAYTEYYSDINTANSEYSYVDIQASLSTPSAGPEVAQIYVEVRNNGSGVPSDTKIEFRQQSSATGWGLVTMGLPMLKNFTATPPSNIWLPISVNGVLADSEGNIEISTGGGGSFALTNGNGTTANGTAVDLGGNQTGNLTIYSSGFNFRRENTGDGEFIDFASTATRQHTYSMNAGGASMQTVNLSNNTSIEIQMTSTGVSPELNLLSTNGTWTSGINIYYYATTISGKNNSGNSQFMSVNVDGISFDVGGTITNLALSFNKLPVYADEAAAAAAFLNTGRVYRDSSGFLHVKL